MEACFARYASLPSSYKIIKLPSIPPQNPHNNLKAIRLQPRRHKLQFSSSAAAPGSGGRGRDTVADLVRELEAEMNGEKESSEWRSEKCRGRKGAVEVLECLECEAIMGEDEGREPNDYNRRAQIFDKSSRVFQALKERRGDVQAPSPDEQY